MNSIKASLIALTACFFAIWLLRPFAHKIGFVDRPGGRKHHETETPLVGGVAIFFAFSLAVLSLHVAMDVYRGLFAGSALILMMGVVDDFKELGSRLRLLGQVIAAVILISYGHSMITDLGSLFFMGPINLGWWSYPTTILAVVVLINAMNMIDGQDGLSGGVALGQVALLMYLAVCVQHYADFRLLMIVAILLTVFLFHNLRTPWRKRASIFMGDSGITFIAFLVAWFAIHLGQAKIQVLKPVTVLWVLAFPIYDLVNVVAHRLYEGRSPLSAGRDHVHHVLHFIGIDTQLSTFLLCLFSVVLGLLGFLLNHLNVSEAFQFILFCILLVGYMLTVRVIRQR
ncbi:MAG: undecaprenyl/decaprenyl-phosphate alpha-N-acetylglucosaminyl 1-phosphate transferase [Gammaproteobacteria bacterium]|nr:undecaprenyl/decaprenyl-phosphate alpha-N-acetylglucosaminyl 1-phosphate transferase [Gammaproteobacteria bacterium]